MTPDINSILALAQAQYSVLSAIDTGGAFACLEPNCCSMFVDQEFTKYLMVQSILLIYLRTGALPTIADPCCPIACGDVTVNGGTGDATFTDVTAATLTLGGAPSVAQIRRGTGTLAAGTATIAATWVTASTRIVATYTTASAAGQANISIGTKTAGVSFVVNGEGTNTFDWIAVV